MIGLLKAYKGHVVYTASPEAFTVIENGYIVVENGIVKAVSHEMPKELDQSQVVDYGDRLIMPGFVDLHFHAPQYPNIGLGLDKELLPWLEDYTFPTEAKFADTDFADRVYRKVVHELLRQGTTRVVLFATIHLESSKLLARILDESGIGAYVGKVNMDRNSSEILIESTENSLRDTEAFINAFEGVSDRVKPIITPRFVPTCTPEVMEGLGQLARKYNVPVQSHISENLGEVKWVSELHPEFKDYASVYDHFGLLNDQTIMAHCVHNTDDEIGMMAERGTFSAHCPNANYNLSSGIMPVRKFLSAGVQVGLGTDVGAGHKVSIAQVMSQAVQGSKMVWQMVDNSLAPLTTSEVFYMATKGGGAFFGNVGSFEPGYEFDALVIDDKSLQIELERSIEERVQRYIYCGDDRNIKARFVKGQEILLNQSE
ncbi:guanine deaminase [Fusibacter sp. JL216-2]|uniref:guanine deaminase n=1 Tax=Fusibacter sp. JL216-2 TaxID=3071453 RepID=UPI003D32ACCE